MGSEHTNLKSNAKFRNIPELMNNARKIEKTKRYQQNANILITNPKSILANKRLRRWLGQKIKRGQRYDTMIGALLEDFFQ